MSTLFAEPAGTGYRVVVPGEVDHRQIPGEYLFPITSGGNTVAHMLQVSPQQLSLTMDKMGIRRVEPFSGLLSPLNDPATREQVKAAMRVGGELTGEAAGYIVQALPYALFSPPTVGGVLTTVGGNMAAKRAGDWWAQRKQRPAKSQEARDRAENYAIKKHQEWDDNLERAGISSEHMPKKGSPVTTDEINAMPDYVWRRRMAETMRDAEESYAEVPPEAIRQRAEDAQSVLDVSEMVGNITRPGYMIDKRIRQDHKKQQKQ